MESNKKIAIIDTNYPINSRNARIVESLRGLLGKENVIVVSWDRKGTQDSSTGEFLYHKSVELGDKRRKLSALFGFGKFVKSVLNAHQPRIIIASHWDALLLGSAIKRGNQILIYENLDMPTGNLLTFRILRMLEKICILKVDAISYASRFYLPFYGGFKGRHILLENKPTDIHREGERAPYSSNKLTIMFNGSIRYKETMLNLFEAVGNNEKVEIHLYGYPSGKEGEEILNKGKEFNNITFFGSYSYEEIPELYSKADLVWAVYPAADINVKYAISNKFHESIAYDVPAIFANDTKLGEMVKQKNIGFTVNAYSVKAIKSLIEDILKNPVSNLGEIARNIQQTQASVALDWDSEFKDFKNYIDEVL